MIQSAKIGGVKDMALKTCTKCKEEKPATLEHFGRRKNGLNGLQASCKKCTKFFGNTYYVANKDKISARQRACRKANPEKEALRHKKYKEANREKIAEYQRSWYVLNKGRATEVNKAYRDANVEKERERRRRYYQLNKGKVNGKRQQRMRNDPVVKLTKTLRNRMRDVLRGHSKSASTIKLLGCSVEHLKAHLESHFKPGMTWNNHGEWHIDHIRPCVSFDLLDPKQQKECFHYSNLQPLWATENLKKATRHSAGRFFIDKSGG